MRIWIKMVGEYRIWLDLEMEGIWVGLVGIYRKRKWWNYLIRIGTRCQGRWFFYARIFLYDTWYFSGWNKILDSYSQLYSSYISFYGTRLNETYNLHLFIIMGKYILCVRLLKLFLGLELLPFFKRNNMFCLNKKS